MRLAAGPIGHEPLPLGLYLVAYWDHLSFDLNGNVGAVSGGLDRFCPSA